MEKTVAKTETTGKSAVRTLDLVYIGIFAALIAVCSWISIPMAIPFTLQTFAVFLTVGLLGGKRGSVAVLIYILLGAVGLPVFAGFTGGLGRLLGMTGGYIVGFLFSALAMWGIEALTRGKTDKKAVQTVLLAGSMVAGLLVCYAFGTVWFVLVYARSTGPIGFGTALAKCVVPYILPDLVKIALALVLCDRLRKVLPGGFAA